MPGLKFVVGARSAAGSVGPVFFLEAAKLHGVKFGHLLQDAGALSFKTDQTTDLSEICHAPPTKRPAGRFTNGLTGGVNDGVLRGGQWTA